MLDINKKNEIEYVIAFDYDGVITKRGSSGLNEEKWLKKESNVIWRKIFNFVSSVYNRYVGVNTEIVKLINDLKDLELNVNNIKIKFKVLVISSHMLTTNNYNESFKTRKRVKNRLKKERINYDDIIFAAGNKIDVCKQEKVDLMIEDNVEKADQLNAANIKTIIKRTDKNEDTLIVYDLVIDNLLEVYPIVLNELYSKKIVDITDEINYYQEYANIKQPIFAEFDFEDELFEPLIGPINDKPKSLKKIYQEYN